MDIDITKLVQEYLDGSLDLMEFSASQWESGPRAGQLTWNNSCEYVHEMGDSFLVGKEDLGNLEDWILGWGAWDQDEVDAMSDAELRALLLQFIAGDLRSLFEHYDGDHEAMAKVEGSVFKSGDSWYYYVGH